MSMLVKLVSLLSAFQLAIAIPGLAPSPSQVSSNPGTQHAQTAGEHWLIIGCFDQFLGAYGYEMDDNLLPPSNSSFLVDVMLDSSNLCNNFQKLNSCLQNRYTALVDFDCLTNLSRSHSDATFYLNQLSMAELFCKESIPFINYSQCSEEIADVSSNDPDGCYQIQWSSCRSFYCKEFIQF
ncbi:hypothetical protein Q1695_002026 [Nippostrongylus brasiliensis]|nr:hypothetical protein Q1695_002026 [Nippostrongylus brasiliensis]